MHFFLGGGVDTSISRWWAERQVNEILAEHPGELVRTGWKRSFRGFVQFYVAFILHDMSVPVFTSTI